MQYYFNISILSAVLSMKERFVSALLLEEHRKDIELKEMRRRVGDLEEFVESHLPSSLVYIQATGEGKDLATAGKKTSFELHFSSQTASSLPFFFEHLSCQLTDPHQQNIHCSTTSTQPGVCTVKYTPIVRGPHQLRITIRGTEIPGNPFTVRVLPSLEMRGVVQHTITGINRPWGVAVSKSGEVVVSEYFSHCISVYSREGKKITSFGSKGSSTGQFRCPNDVAITSDNHILVADENNSQIQMFTMEGRFVKSIGQKGHKPLQFNHPAAIAVDPSGRVFVTDSSNNRIQVLNSDLSYSHMFGSKGSAPGKFRYPCDVAINSSGVVYVADCNNSRVQLFFADGQFISSFGNEGSQYGRLHHPSGICVDSTNTVYVTDEKNHCVAVYTSSGQFIKCFGTHGSEEGELHCPEGVAVDNTTGELYVCDCSNDRVVIY